MPKKGRKNKIDLGTLPKWAGYLSGKKRKREFKSAARLQFKPIQKQVQGEIRASKTRQKKEIPSWFKAYQDTIDKGRGETEAKYKAVQAQLSGQTKASSDRATSRQRELQAQDVKDAAVRGTKADTTEAKRSADAASSRASAANTNYATVAGQGASQFSYLTDKKRIGEGEKINQLLKESARERSLRQDKQDVSREKRDFLTDLGRQLRGDERDFYIQNKAFAEDRRGQKQQMKLAKQYGENKRREQKRSVRGQKKIAGIHAKNERADDKRAGKWKNQGGGGGGGASKEEVRRAVSLLKRGAGDKFKTPKQGIHYLRTAGISSAAARKATRRVRKQVKGKGGHGGGPTGLDTGRR